MLPPLGSLIVVHGAYFAAQTPRFRPYVEITLRGFADESPNGERPRALAEAILDELAGLAKNQIADLRTRNV